METVEKIKLTEKQIADVENGKIVAIKASWDEFLEFTLQCKYKTDYHNGEIIIMGAANPLHELLVSDFIMLFGNFYKSKGYLIAGSNLGISIPEMDSYYNPDVTIIKDKLKFKKDSKFIITNPFIIIEILSKSTAYYDFFEKRQKYQKLEDLQEMVFVDRFLKTINVFKRTNDPKVWMETIYDSPNDLVVVDILTFELGGIFNNLPNIPE